ncbi:MAG: STAS/SEC14 domain-containing protein [Blastocatellia bacterium]
METMPGQLSTEQIISAVSQLSLQELERVFDRVLALQAERKAPRASEEEPALIARINQGLPDELRARLSLLRAKREDETITDAEYEELTRLTLQAEELHAERMAAMIKLARLRGVSLPALMGQLNIHFPENV